MPQSHTEDKPVAPQGNDTEHKQPSYIKRTNTIKQPAPSFSAKCLAKLENALSAANQNKDE